MSDQWVCACGCRRTSSAANDKIRVRCPKCGKPMHRTARQKTTPSSAAPSSATPSSGAVQSASDGMLHVVCRCGARFRAPPEMAGRQVRCTKCNQPLTVPHPEVDLGSPDDLAGALAEIDDLSADLQAMDSGNPLGLAGGKRLPSHGKSKHRTRSASGGDGSRKMLFIAGGCIGGCVVLLIVVMVVQSMSRPSVTTDNSLASSAVAQQRDRGRLVFDDSAGHSSPSNDASNNQFGSSTAGTPDASTDASSAGGGGMSASPFEPQTEGPTSVAGGDWSSESGAETGTGVPSGPRLELAVQQWLAAGGGQLRGAIPTGKDEDTVVAQYSWMTQLLPYLGHEKLYHSFDFKKPWTDQTNSKFATAIIPDFLSPNDSRQRWQGGDLTNLGLTHFVGITGLDQRNRPAALLPRSDPRAGVFGYDSVARSAEITDGTSNTLMIAGAGHLTGPWVAGGGATLRGVKEDPFAELTGFSTAGSRRGTFAVMADGSTRFISADIDPSVFRALSTIHGGETVDDDAIGSRETFLPTQRKQ